MEAYLDVVKSTLEAALCLVNFGSQNVERHNKPEIEAAYVWVGASLQFCAFVYLVGFMFFYVVLWFVFVVSFFVSFAVVEDVLFGCCGCFVC